GVGLKPKFAEAHNNRGAALHELNRFEEAIASYDKAIAPKPNYAEAHNNRGAALNALKRHEEALASYERAIALKPDCEFVLGSLIHTRMKICHWSNLETQIAQFLYKINCAEKISQPFPLLAVTNSPKLQRKAAEIFTHARYPANTVLPKIIKRQRCNKIRIGYFSADFRNHALASLMAELFERHNRSQFEVTGI